MFPVTHLPIFLIDPENQQVDSCLSSKFSLIPDNLRSAVSRAHRYESDTNPTYHDLACHHGVAALPARAKKPRDKAKAEVGDRELMLPTSLTKRLANHARPQDVTEGYAADWTMDQLRENARRIADRIDKLIRI